MRAKRESTSALLAACSGAFFLLALTAISPAPGWGLCGDDVVDGAARPCCGDCDGDLHVTVDEILRVVVIALGSQPVEPSCTTGCPCAQPDQVCIETQVDHIVSVINTALSGCPPVSAGPFEECDDGGICIGGSSAGQPCTGEGDCEGSDGVCVGGLLEGTACDNTPACDGGICTKCKTFGGDGCAANCTEERAIAYPLVPGTRLSPTSTSQLCAPETSCTTSYLEILSVPLSVAGELTLVVGNERGGAIPAVMRPFHLQYPVDHENTGCLRGLVFKTCGGTLFESDGTLSPRCGLGLADEVDCPQERPCAAAFGPGNAAAGVIGCDGLDGVETSYVEDCYGYFPPPEPLGRVRRGTGAAGSAFLYGNALIDQGGWAPGNASLIQDFCTDKDTPAGDLFLLPLTTGASFSRIWNRDGDFRESEETDPPTQTFGRPFQCSALENGITSGATLIGASGGCTQHFFSSGPLTVKFVSQ